MQSSQVIDNETHYLGAVTGRYTENSFRSIDYAVNLRHPLPKGNAHQRRKIRRAIKQVAHRVQSMCETKAGSVFYADFASIEVRVLSHMAMDRMVADFAKEFPKTEEYTTLIRRYNESDILNRVPPLLAPLVDSPVESARRTSPIFLYGLGAGKIASALSVKTHGA